jgi:hypothetical protein
LVRFWRIAEAAFQQRKVKKLRRTGRPVLLSNAEAMLLGQ